MADIELVIKMPEEMYKWVNNVNKFLDDYGTSDFIDLIKNGTLIPKGHDKLIDADVLRKELIANEWITDDDGGGLEDILHNSPAIIEADNAESEENDAYSI